MTYSIDFQNAYVDLYRLMRNYIWDLDVVEMLADVEVATYDAFIDLEKLNKMYQKLYPLSMKATQVPSNLPPLTRLSQKTWKGSTRQRGTVVQ